MAASNENKRKYESDLIKCKFPKITKYLDSKANKCDFALMEHDIIKKAGLIFNIVKYKNLYKANKDGCMTIQPTLSTEIYYPFEIGLIKIFDKFSIFIKSIKLNLN